LQKSQVKMFRSKISPCGQDINFMVMLRPI